jgi:hypothetical protein
MKIANLNIPNPKVCGVAFVIPAEDKANAGTTGPPPCGSPGRDDIDKQKDTRDVEKDLDKDT